MSNIGINRGSNTLDNIIDIYSKVVDKFKMRADVQNGIALGYRDGQDPNGRLRIENRPKGIGDGTTTTGWCVSASQALLFDNVFKILMNTRGARAKLISIDIKEQHWGYCYSGSQNKWHTAILVMDSGIQFVIDITCGQFGPDYVNKNFWTLDTWMKTFRSASCTHIVNDFENVNLSPAPLASESVVVGRLLAGIVRSLKSCTSISDSEREVLGMFFANKVDVMNNKIIMGNLTNLDFDYLRTINGILENLDFKNTVDSGDQKYFVQMFPNKLAALNWLKLFMTNDLINMGYWYCSNSPKENCLLFGYDSDELFKPLNPDDEKSPYYVIVELDYAYGVGVAEFIDNAYLMVPHGNKMYPGKESLEKSVFNAGDRMGKKDHTNTFIISVSMMEK